MLPAIYGRSLLLLLCMATCLASGCEQAADLEAIQPETALFQIDEEPGFSSRPVEPRPHSISGRFAAFAGQTAELLDKPGPRHALTARSFSRRGGRAVEGSGLANCQGESPRGFESHPLRHSLHAGAEGHLLGRGRWCRKTGDAGLAWPRSTPRRSGSDRPGAEPSGRLRRCGAGCRADRSRGRGPVAGLPVGARHETHTRTSRENAA